MHLARLLRLDEITAVAVPSVEQEAARDLVRAREDCRGDLMRARHRLSKLLLRHGHRLLRRPGLDRHARRLAAPATLRQRRRPQLTFDSDYEAVLAVKARRDRLDAAIEEMAADSEFTPVVRRLGCLRGVCTLTGFALAVEIGDWHRFTGNTIGSFVGLVPSEYSSGASRVQGSITKTGNTHVRRLLVEAAWHHRARYAPARPCATAGTWPHQPPGPAATQATGGCTTAGSSSPSAARRHVIANVAIARELAGWCWSLAVTRRLATPTSCFVDHRPVVAARGATRDTAMSSRPIPAGDARP